MSFDAGTILGHLKLDRSGFASGMLEATGLTQAFGSTISTFMVNPLLGAINVAKEAAVALAGVVKGAVDAAVEIGRLEETTGASAHFLSAMAYAAKSVDLPAEAAADSFNQLTRAIRESVKGSGPAADAMRELGVNVRDANGQLRPTEDVFMDVADGIGRYRNATERAAIAQEIFGRSGMRLLPILSKGRSGIQGMIAEADQLGATMSENDVKGAQAFHEELNKLDAVWEGLKRDIGLDIARELAADLKEAAPDIRAFARDVSKALVPALHELYDILKAVAPLFKAFAFLASPEYAVSKIREWSNPKTAGQGGSSGVSVNVTVDPEASAREVSNKVAPHIVRAVRGVQEGVEESTRRKMAMQGFSNSLAAR